MANSSSGNEPPNLAGRRLTKSRNLLVGERRSSARLEPEIREALRDICEREGTTQADLCATVEARKRPDQSLSSALRTFVVAYFRNAAHEEWERENK